MEMTSSSKQVSHSALVRLAVSVLVGASLWYLVSTLVFFFGVEQPRNYAIGSDVSIMLGLILVWLYFAGLESSAQQATLGKMVLRLMVTDVDGQRLSFARASVRYWAKLVSALPLGIGFMLAEISPKKQALYDRIAGSVVVRTGG